MRARGFPMVVAVAAFMLAACSTTDSRIRREQALFDGYPPQVKEQIRNGVIDVGYTPEMVVMALGEPDRKVDAQTGDGAAEGWIYRKTTPGISIGLGRGSYVGSGVGIGTGVTVGEPARSEDRARVEFRDGRVSGFEVGAQE